MSDQPIDPTFAIETQGLTKRYGAQIVVEAAVEQFSGTIPAFNATQQCLPGANDISLGTMFGPVGGGLLSSVSGPALGSPPCFSWVLTAYIASFLVVGAVLFTRRDIG